ncbi:MAG: HAD-IA family hydrolase [Actinomycetota bacterium]|nr:HAD-IA family hydrolase [Actinomycetota bacterium]
MRGLIFDFDGLVIDSETLTAKVAMEIVSERGGTSELGDWAPLFGPTGPDIDTEWGRTLTRLLGPHVDPAEFDALLTERRRPLVDDLQPLPGVLELMEAARKKGWKIGLATGHDGTPLMSTLERLRLLGRFDAIVQTTEVGRSKPAPDILLEAARRLQLDPHECLVLEDSIAGYQAAEAAGMSVVVCPCEVTKFSTFPDEVMLVESLVDVNLDDYP